MKREAASVLSLLAAGLLAASLLFPYWGVRLFAPQYRDGLSALIYAHKVAGDITEIDMLNHYVGVAKLGSLARWERAAAIPITLALALFCVLGGSFQKPLWRYLGTLAVVLFPILFVLDMSFWMQYASTHLDPMAPLKLKPFRIPLWGVGKVGQFRSEVYPLAGFVLSVSAALMMAAALWLREKVSQDKIPCCEASSKRRSAALAVIFLLGAWLPSGQAQSIAEQLARAEPGAVVDIPAGNYRETIVIDKPVILRGQAGAVLDGGGSGTVLTVRGAGTTVEGLVIRGSGESLLGEDSGVRIEAASVTIRNCLIEDTLFGIFLAQAPDALIERNVLRGKPLEPAQRGDLIRLWYSDRATLRANRLEGGRDTVLWFSSGSVLEGNEIRGGRYGLHFMYTNHARIAGNVFSENSVGAYVMYSNHIEFRNNRFENNRGPSGIGLGLKESDFVVACGNAFSKNRQGIFIDQSPLVSAHTNRFQDNLFAFNDTGIAMMPSAEGNVFSGNTLEENTQQVSVRGGGDLSGNEWSQDRRGNYWSDYAGYGEKGSLTGRLPYRLENAFENIADRHPLVRFFLFTPAAQMLDLAGRAFPVFRPRPKVVDPFPLLEPAFQGLAAQPLPTPPVQVASFKWFAAPAALGPILLIIWNRKRPNRNGSCQATITGAGASVIEVRNVFKSFGKRQILNAVSFELHLGESLVLWGPNGSGKTTLMKCLLGLREFEGSIHLFGHDVRREGHVARRQAGYLPQEFAGYDWTVEQSMKFTAAVRGESCSAIGPALAACGLLGEESKMTGELSGGMKQKLALAQALIADPALLLLDEPCANLDLKSRKELLDILYQFKGRRTLVLTSHRLEEVQALADHVLWIEEGRPARLLGLAEFQKSLHLESSWVPA